MDFSSLLSPQNVTTGLDAKNQDEVFSQAASLFEKNNGLPRKVVLNGLVEREKLGSTALGHAVALPHARIKGLPASSGALLKLENPIDFDAPDKIGVQLFFVLLVPSGAAEMHLQILGELAQRFSDRQMRQSLMNASSGAELYQRFVSGT